MKTIVAKQKKWNERKWYLVDAQGQTLWRMATKIAILIKGKDEASFTPHLDNGAYVVVVNCDKFSVTGPKLTEKLYKHHTRWLGGTKTASLKDLLVKKPEQPLKYAVMGMLPKTKHRDNMLARLKLFTTSEHTYVAQKPEVVQL